MFVISLVISSSDRLFAFSFIHWGIEVYIGLMEGGVEDHTKAGTSEKIIRTLWMHLEPYKSIRKM